MFPHTQQSVTFSSVSKEMCGHTTSRNYTCYTTVHFLLIDWWLLLHGNANRFEICTVRSHWIRNLDNTLTVYWWCLMVIVMIKEQGTKILYKNKEAPWTVEKKNHFRHSSMFSCDIKYLWFALNHAKPLLLSFNPQSIKMICREACCKNDKEYLQSCLSGTLFMLS